MYIFLQPLPDHHSGPSAMIVPPLPVLPSLHPLFQEVPTEAAISLPIAPDEPYLVYSGGTLSNTAEEHVSLPDVFKSFPYLMEI